MNNPDTMRLKNTQISKFLSPQASTINKLNELALHKETCVSPKALTSKPKMTKKTSKLNLKRLNSSGCLNESVSAQTQASKYFKKVHSEGHSSKGSDRYSWDRVNVRQGSVIAWKMSC